MLINNILIIKHVQRLVSQVARIPLADDPKPEVFPENSEFNLVKRIGGYCFVYWSEPTEIIQKCVLGIVRLEDPNCRGCHLRERCGLTEYLEISLLLS